MDGISNIKDTALVRQYKDSIEADSSTDHLINIVGKVLEETKKEGTYSSWMKNAFESASVTNASLSETLKRFLITQVIFATTNYDRLLEQATSLATITYEEPEKTFFMLDHRKSEYVIHLHGVYDSVNGLDNIVADQQQYDKVLNDKGAQFIQQILGTRTLIFVGCGQTTEDGNISQFIEFARKYLHMNQTYYFFYKEGSMPVDMPDNVMLISYGDEYYDLPLFLEDMAQERLRAVFSKHRLIGRSIYQTIDYAVDSLMQYHYALETVPFCGREKELYRLTEYLQSDATFSWWSVTGQAGAGKSRLALEMLRKLPVCWFGFFINDRAAINDIDDFSPFADTVIIVDYVSGRESVVAKYMCRLKELFAATTYKLT